MLNKGIKAYDSQDYGLAEKLLLEYLDNVPGNHKVRFILVQVYEKQDRLQKALSLAQEYD
jgi:predicted Zn-dependent protease